MRPNVFSALSAMSLTAAWSPTSAMTISASVPTARTSSATRSQSSLLREPLTTTLNPIDASSLAQARPMLRPDPVISAVLLPLAIPVPPVPLCLDRLTRVRHSSSAFATSGPNSASASSTNSPNWPSR